MGILIFRCVSFCLCCLFGVSSAANLCPSELKVNEAVSDIDQGWEAITDPARRGYRLDGVRVYFGHPSNLASLVPDSSERAGNVLVSVWHFSAGVEKYWLACSYQNTRQIAIKELNAGIKFCQLKQQLTRSGSLLKIQSIECR